MKLITAPNVGDYNPSERKLFLAGGISGCGNWHKEVIEALKDDELVIFNPRREGILDRKNVAISREQIKWEYFYLREANEIMFWFPDTSVCPIALFELGGALERGQTIYVGCDVNYDRIVDLFIQVEFAKRGIKIVHTLDELIQQIQTF